MLERAFTVAMQNIFFPKCKLPPKPRWVAEIEELGKTAAFSVLRRGRVLSGVIIFPTQTQKIQKLAIFVHPISRRGKYFFGEGSRIRCYLELGYRVAIFDFNGFGESDRIDMHYWRDADAVVRFFAAQGAYHHVVLHGVSLGAFHMIRAISSLPPESSVVIENTNRSFYDYWKRWFITGNLIRLFDMLSLKLIKDANPITALARLDRKDLRYLFIACEKDIYTPAEEMRDLLESVTSPHKTFLVFKNCGHFEAPHSDAALYRKAIRDIAKT